MKEIKKFIVVTILKTALLVSVLGSFMMPGNTASWLPIMNAAMMGFIYCVLKANIKGF